MRKISNSEATAWLACRRQYLWGYYRNLTPKRTPDNFTRGTLGHLAFQRYAEALMAGLNHDAAMKAAESAFKDAVGHLEIAIIMQTQFLFTRYMNHPDNKGWPYWRVINTEQHHDLKMNDDITLPLRYDIMVEERATGKVLIGDFKYTYDFWRFGDHDLNGQLPKYIYVMNANGIQVHGGFLEEIRTRELGKEKASQPKNLWRRTQYRPTLEKKRNLIKQHLLASMEITDFWNLPTDEEREFKAIPVLDKYGICKNCFFREACATYLDGGDVDLYLDMHFTQNTYGYNEQISEELV